MMSFVFLYFFLIKLKEVKIRFALNTDKIENFIFYVVIFTVIGSRLFEVLFYSGEFFLKNPLEIFAIWHGGLSFHGGLFGFFTYSFYFCKKNKINYLEWLDYCSIPAALGLTLGRIANFLNGELYGLPVYNQMNPPWYAVLFQNTDPQHLYRYPVQLFESFGNFITLILLCFIWKIWKKRFKIPFNGILGFSFLLFYAIFRFFIEFWKDYARDTFCYLTTGQLLTLPLFVFGIWGVFKSIQQGLKTRSQYR